MQQFDLGRFDDDTMAFPPSVVVKDYTWNNSPGYLHVAGTTEKRYQTIIQIVPAEASSIIVEVTMTELRSFDRLSGRA